MVLLLHFPSVLSSQQQLYIKESISEVRNFNKNKSDRPPVCTQEKMCQILLHLSWLTSIKDIYDEVTIWYKKHHLCVTNWDELKLCTVGWSLVSFQHPIISQSSKRWFIWLKFVEDYIGMSYLSCGMQNSFMSKFHQPCRSQQTPILQRIKNDHGAMWTMAEIASHCPSHSQSLLK